VWPYRKAGAGRREFGRVVLSSLAASARNELESRRERGQRLRARRAERRLAELEEALDRLEQGLAPARPQWYATGVALALATAGVIAAGAGLVAAVVVRGTSGPLVGALDVLMLVATLAWFSAAAGHRARGVRRHPPNGGSPSESRDR
jgi:Flp pilus assembly protein TadB